MNKAKILSTLGIALLLPTILYFMEVIGFVLAVFNTVQSSAMTGTAVDPKLLVGEISSHIVKQILNLIVLLPGLITCSIVCLKLKYHAKWFDKILRVYAWLLIISLPLLTLAGIYLHWLVRRKVT